VTEVKVLTKSVKVRWVNLLPFPRKKKKKNAALTECNINLGEKEKRKSAKKGQNRRNDRIGKKHFFLLRMGDEKEGRERDMLVSKR